MIESKAKSDKSWETVTDFTKIKKGGIGINQLLSRFVLYFINRKKK